MTEHPADNNGQELAETPVDTSADAPVATGFEASTIPAEIRVPVNPAVYFDGSSNRKRRVELRFSVDLEIIEDDTVAAVWPYTSVRRAHGPDGLLRLSSDAAMPLARLDIEHAGTAELLLMRAPLLKSTTSAQTPAWRIVAWSLGAIASILLVVFFGIPVLADRLAPLVPERFEKRMGETVEKQLRYVFNGTSCTNAEGQAAFNVLMDKLKRAGNLETALESHVVRTRPSIPNALALPGGKVYLFDDLLQKANNVDEIAGVMAHELGHVQHRDNMRKMIQTGGTSYLVGLLFGDIMGGSAVIFVAKSLLDASHSRDAETNADQFAIDVMRKLGRSAKPMGEFLVRITDRPILPKPDAKTDMKAEPKPASKTAIRPTTNLFASHPLSADRLERMKVADRPNTGPELLDAAQWAALKAICKGTELPRQNGRGSGSGALGGRT